MFYVNGGGIPSVGGADAWDSSEHVVRGPCVDPRLKIVEARAGPQAVSGRGDEKGPVGERVIAFVGVFLKIRRFGSKHAVGPRCALLDFVVDLSEPDEPKVAHEFGVRSVPVVEAAAEGEVALHCCFKACGETVPSLCSACQRMYGACLLK